MSGKGEWTEVDYAIKSALSAIKKAVRWHFEQREWMALAAVEAELIPELTQAAATGEPFAPDLGAIVAAVERILTERGDI